MNGDTYCYIIPIHIQPIKWTLIMLVISRDIHESFILLLPTGEKITITKLERGRVGVLASRGFMSPVSTRGGE